ncbi:MAG: complex I NDUFA9 subunit family protein [Alphaproteobacteria bacterium]
MPRGPVTVFGGTGFLGRHIVGRLLAAGEDVRVAARNPGRARFHEDSAVGDRRPTHVRADVRDESSVARAVEGAAAVVNAVAAYVEKRGVTFAGVHEQGARNVARRAAEGGVERLVHISGIGAAPTSRSSYARARGRGERLAAQAFPGATILRPSVLFGAGDAFFTRLAALTTVLPALPLFGGGGTRLQPVHVGDVAEAVSRVLGDSMTRGRTYELGGPGVHTYAELVRLLLRVTHRRRLLVPLPFVVAEMQALCFGLLPNPPLTLDEVKLLREDNVVGPDALGFEDLGIAPVALEAILPSYLGGR